MAEAFPDVNFPNHGRKLHRFAKGSRQLIDPLRLNGIVRLPARHTIGKPLPHRRLGLVVREAVLLQKIAGCVVIHQRQCQCNVFGADVIMFQTIGLTRGNIDQMQGRW